MWKIRVIFCRFRLIFAFELLFKPSKQRYFLRKRAGGGQEQGPMRLDPWPGVNGPVTKLYLTLTKVKLSNVRKHLAIFYWDKNHINQLVDKKMWSPFIFSTKKYQKLFKIFQTLRVFLCSYFIKNTS